MKTTCKQTLAFFLCALLLCGTLPVAAFAADVLSGNCGKNGDNVTWTLDTGTDVLTISGTGKMFDYGGIYNSGGYAISGGGTEAPWFDNRLSVRTVNIGDGVTHIGDCAFLKCENLESITIPDSVTTIGSRAFSGCLNLIDTTIPSGVITIGRFAFWDCQNFSSVTIPRNTKIIDDGVFYGCNGLAHVTIPNSVTEIGESAFGSCKKLSSVTIGNSVTKIGANAFDLAMLSSVFIPRSVQEIGRHAFHCGYYEYSKFISSVQSFAVDPENAYYSSKDDVLYNRARTEIVRYPGANPRTSFTVPNGVTQIGADAFCQCANLVSVTLPNGVTTIGDTAFLDCENIARITLPDGVVSIGNMAFWGCEHIESFILPDSVTSIGNDLFCYCHHLRFVHFPAGLTGFDGDLFWQTDLRYICSDTADCYAKTYAEANGIEFRVCDGHGEPEKAPTICLLNTKKSLPFGEKRTLTAEVENLPDGGKIVWTADSECVELKPSADGKTCVVSAKKNGKATVTTTIVDKDGKPVKQNGTGVSASVTLQAKATFFHKLWHWLFRIPWPFG